MMPLTAPSSVRSNTGSRWYRVMACQVLFDGGAIRSGHSAIIATTPQEAFPQQLLIGELLLPVRPAASRKPVENRTHVEHRAFRLLAFRVLHVSLLIVACHL